MAAERTDETRDTADIRKLVEENVGLAFAEAARCGRRGISRDDLRAEAVAALFLAARRFERERGLRFSTYAVPCIRHALSDALRRSEAVIVPKGFAQKRAEILRELGSGIEASGEAGESLRRAATAAGTSERKAREMLAVPRAAERLDFDGRDCRMHEPRSAFETPEERLVRKEKESALKSALTRLRKRDPRAFDVLSRHCGFFSPSGQGEPFSEIGRALGMTRQNACAIEKRALRFLRSSPELLRLAE